MIIDSLFYQEMKHVVKKRRLEQNRRGCVTHVYMVDNVIRVSIISGHTLYAHTTTLIVHTHTRSCENYATRRV